MKQEVKKAWTKALRSGEYEQGYFRLRNPETNSYCCLGVLCDVLENQFPSIIEKTPEWRDYKSLPWIIKANLDILSKGDNDRISQLMAMNDSQTVSFETIADVIEAIL